MGAWRLRVGGTRKGFTDTTAPPPASHPHRPIKWTLPGPMTMIDTLADRHYGSREKLAWEFARIRNEEARELAALGVRFDRLLTLANMPVQRFARQLELQGELDAYQQLLVEAHNPDNLESVMCRSLVSVDWQGRLFDCDFNQQLGLEAAGKGRHLRDLLDDNALAVNQPICTAAHCYGCTAGAGSSCGGALQSAA